MKDLSPNELQQLMLDYRQWVTALGDQYVTGQRLEKNGVAIASKTSEVATDGPFLESKEVIAGFFLIRANDIQEATAIAHKAPHLGLYSFEIRPIALPAMK